MDDDKVDRLYQCYQIIVDAKEKGVEHEEEYLEILKSVKGEYKEKMLASQFIPRFFTEFPSLQETALDCLLDLVEDKDLTIRKQAVKNLPSICKYSKSYIPKVSDIMTQMLQCEDASELAIVNFSLVTVMKLDLKGTLSGIFSQLAATEDELVRKRGISFICSKLPFLPEDMMTKDAEEYVLEQCKKLFQDVTYEEFSSFMTLLSSFKLAKTVTGQQMLVDIIVEQAELDKEFSYSTPDNVHCLLQCVRQALPLFTPFVSSAPFVKYFTLHVLPDLKELTGLISEMDASLELIKLLAEIVPYCINLEENKPCLEKLHNCLLEYIPHPPIEVDSEKLASEPNLQFTHIECLLYAFHQLSKKYPEFFIAEENADRCKDFKTRLQYLALNIQSGIKSVRESLAGEKGKVAKSEENKVKSVALSTMTNISSLIKDFFHNPPTYRTTIALSWKPTAASQLKKAADSPATNKRKEITAPETAEKPKRDFKTQRQIYSPPAGKYSSNIKKYYPNTYYRGRGRGRQFY